MRHRKKINHLGRKSAHRVETLSSLATSLILHKRINTTLAKAKALRVFVEPLITKSKVDSTHSRRTVFGYLRSKQAVSELFREIAQKVADRPGGYTRILKTGFRQGDSAEMCLIELVDYNANMLKVGEEAKQKTTRRGRRKKAGTETAETAPVASSGKKTKEPAAASDKPAKKTQAAAESAPEKAGKAETVHDVVDTAQDEITDAKVEETTSDVSGTVESADAPDTDKSSGMESGEENKK